MGIGNEPRKGRVEMSSQSQITRTLIAVVAALAMSTVAIGAAVGPAQANANPVKVTINA
jgi:predicted ATP-binding protein involved in virulence